MSDAYVWIDPARRSGEPCIGGMRVPIYMVGDMAWSSSVKDAEETWKLSRAQVLVACWFLGVYGIDTIHRKRAPLGYKTRFPSMWCTRWRSWAESNAGALWNASIADYDDIPDPPTKGPRND